MTEATDRSPRAARRRGLIWTALAYALGLVAAVGVGALAPGGALWQVAVGTAVGTVVVFGFSVALDNTSLYDPYWSVAPVAMAAAWVLLGRGLDARAALLLVVVGIWGARLTANWVRRWRGLADEDWRYAQFRRGGRLAYWAVSFVGLHFFPTVLTFLGTLPVYLATAAPGRDLNALDLLGAAVALGGAALEGVADTQLHRFLATDRAARAPFLATGVWAHSRHPNYLGELLFWWGLCLIGLAAAPAGRWVLAGPLAITLLFAAYSVPAMDRRMRRRDGFDAHCAAVPALVPGRSAAARIAKRALALGALAGLAYAALTPWGG